MGNTPSLPAPLLLARSPTGDTAERATARTLRVTVTCAQFASYWLRSYPRAAPSTRNTYGFAVRRFAQDLGDIPLGSVTRADAVEWASRHTWAAGAVRAMYGDAVREGTVSHNPFAHQKLRRTRGRRDLIPLSVEEVDQLASLATRVHSGPFGVTFRAAILLLAWTGIRPGELVALQWNDIATDTLAIRRSLPQKGPVGPPKNGFERIVALPAVARAAIETLERGEGHDCVFRARSGRPLSYWSLLRDWCALRNVFSKPHTQLYELRHFCASQLLVRGVAPKIIALQLGHRDGGQLVLSTYGHLYAGTALKEINAAMDRTP